jgi:hypothetical protein
MVIICTCTRTCMATFHNLARPLHIRKRHKIMLVCIWARRVRDGARKIERELIRRILGRVGAAMGIVT